MQKKIIALAVAGLVSGAAFAQSNVTVYGIADAAFQYSSSSYVNGVKSQSAINDGGQDGSRVGFKGTEDLGNGLKAFFQLEQRFHLDTTENSDDNSTGLGQRNSNVGLMGNWGTVKAGSFSSVHDDYNGYSEAGGMGWGNGALDMLTTVDARNAVEYISPNFSGLEFKVGYSTAYYDKWYDFLGLDGQETEVETQDNDDENNRAFFGAVAYANGPLKVAFTFDRAKFQSEDDGTGTSSEYLLGGSYNFGPVALGAGYDRSKDKWDNVRKTWRINVGAPITANDTIALSYSRAKIDWNSDWGMEDGKAKGWGLSYSHAMSKRTNVYATYGTVSQNDILEGSPYDQAISGSYERAFKVGMRHFF